MLRADLPYIVDDTFEVLEAAIKKEESFLPACINIWFHRRRGRAPTEVCLESSSFLSSAFIKNYFESSSHMALLWGEEGNPSSATQAGSLLCLIYFGTINNAPRKSTTNKIWCEIISHRLKWFKWIVVQTWLLMFASAGAGEKNKLNMMFVRRKEKCANNDLSFAITPLLSQNRITSLRRLISCVPLLLRDVQRALLQLRKQAN